MAFGIGSRTDLLSEGRFLASTRKYDIQGVSTPTTFRLRLRGRASVSDGRPSGVKQSAARRPRQSATLERVEKFLRQQDGQWLLSESVGPDAVCRFESLDCQILVADIYHRVTLAEMEMPTVFRWAFLTPVLPGDYVWENHFRRNRNRQKLS